MGAALTVLNHLHSTKNPCQQIVLAIEKVARLGSSGEGEGTELHLNCHMTAGQAHRQA